MRITWDTHVKCLSDGFLVFKTYMAPSFPSLQVTGREGQDNLKENQVAKAETVWATKSITEVLDHNPFNKTNTH